MSNDTCYLERSEVRRILIGQPDESLYITEQVLADIDALPILTAADIGVPAQHMPDPALVQELADVSESALLPKWLDMDEAPKNGMPICYINRFGEIGHCHWDVFPHDDIDGVWWDDNRDDEVRPLHWMPALPPIPSSFSSTSSGTEPSAPAPESSR